MKHPFLTALPWLLGLSISIVHAGIQDTAREVQQAHQDAIVYLKAVVEVPGRDGNNREVTVETLGTIIAKDGLIVTSNSMLGQAPNKDGKSPELQDLKALMPDGAELAAKLVLQDTELDLAFVRLEGEDAVHTAISLPEDGPRLEIFDQVISLARQEEDLQRLSSVVIARINAKIRRPRLFYVASVGAFGAPAFDDKGNFVGIFVRKIHQGAPASQILLPTKSIHKISQQLEPEKEEVDQEEGAALQDENTSEEEPIPNKESDAEDDNA